MSRFTTFILGLCLLFLPGTITAQLPGAPVMHVPADGRHFIADLYRIGSGGQIILSVDDRGHPRMTALGEGRAEYSTFIGPDYGRMVSFSGLQIEYYRDTQRAGKLARVGPIELEYYDPYTGDIRAGKLMRIGMMELDYYLEIEGENKMGRLSDIGGLKVDYYYGGGLDGKILQAGGVKFNFFLQVPDDVRSGKISSLTGEQPGWVIRIGIE